MIKIKENKKNKEKSEPYYLLTFDYMIGDANGDTSETVKISKDNPYLERFYTLLTKIKPVKGHWGIILESDRLEDTYEEGQLTEDDYNFLSGLMYEGIETDYFDVENDKYTWEFSDGVQGEAEYSFLVFQGLELTYVDEYGVTHETEVV